MTLVMYDGCIEWPGSHDAKGYSTVHLNGKNRKAHRVLWEAAFGPIPEGLQVHHRCENKGCVNLSHLQLVTPHEHKQIHGLSGITARLATAELCAQGHPFDGHNGRQRTCSICMSNASRRWRERQTG